MIKSTITFSDIQLSRVSQPCNSHGKSRKHEWERFGTFSNKTPSNLEVSLISVSIDDANFIAWEAHSAVTAVILRTPFAIPSSDMRANAAASLVFEMCVPDTQGLDDTTA
jgi:hypothetical protein